MAKEEAIMFLQRAAGFLLARRFSPRVIPSPRTAPARSFHSLKDLPIGHGLRGARGASVAAAAFAGVGTLVVQYFMEVPGDDESAARSAREKEIEEEIKALAEYFRKGPDDDESAARKKEEEMKARFENWMKSYDKTYRNEKEKAMRFQVFKDTMKWIESQPPSSQKLFLPGNCFADLRSDEYPCSQSCCCIDDSDDPDSEEYRENKFMAENENVARKKEEDMKAKFENWMKSYNKTYRDEKEKAMRFQVFKDTMKWIESQPPSTQKKLLPGNCFADLRSDELPCSQSCYIDGSDDPNSEEYRENMFMAENENGDTIVWKPEWKPPVKEEMSRQLSRNIRRKCGGYI